MKGAFILPNVIISQVNTPNDHLQKEKVKINKILNFQHRKNCSFASTKYLARHKKQRYEEGRGWTYEMATGEGRVERKQPKED